MIVTKASSTCVRLMSLLPAELQGSGSRDADCGAENRMLLNMVPRAGSVDVARAGLPAHVPFFPS